ncbi:hypothetical protein B1748_35355, partial [Paenibacillus sp. MY03]
HGNINATLVELFPLFSDAVYDWSLLALAATVRIPRSKSLEEEQSRYFQKEGPHLPLYSGI